MPGLRCVVFDIDDTLYLERDYVRSGFLAVATWVRERLGVQGFFEQAWEAFRAGIRGTVFDAAVDALGLDRTLVATLVDVYRRHRPSIELLPDAQDCLRRLHGRVALAVVSDGPLESQRAKAEALGLEPWLAAQVLTAELGPAFEKPHPRAFRIVEEETECHGSDCAYVADNPAKDFGGPKSLGWRTVRVRRSMGLHREGESGPDIDVEVPDLSKLDLVPSFAA